MWGVGVQGARSKNIKRSGGAIQVARGLLVLSTVALAACGGSGSAGTSAPASTTPAASSVVSASQSSRTSGLASSRSPSSSSVSSRLSSSASFSSGNSSRASSPSAASSHSASAGSSGSASSVSSVVVISSSSSVPAKVQLRGQVSFDFVPVQSYQGLNYRATRAKPVRRARVNILDSNRVVLASTQTNGSGYYRVSVPSQTSVTVQVEAYAYSGNRWDIRVEDNTRANALYALEGALRGTGTGNSRRDLHAASGWTGQSYTQPRAAAPFAILDTALQGVQTLAEADAQLRLPTSVFRWSVNNSTASGQISSGAIGTSFFDGQAVYLLGQADSDTDEYDAHVVLHEWGHFLEQKVGRRVDSIGGSHSTTEKLDMRLAYSEGLATAIAGYVLADPHYRDTLGNSQGYATGADIGRKNIANPGWFSESSIQSILYHLSKAGHFKHLYSVLQDDLYASSAAFVSIFSFADRLARQHPAAFAVLDTLMSEQGITGRAQFGKGETNAGNTTGILPLYRHWLANGTPVRVCSSQVNGRSNKLGVHKFLKVMAPTSGTYQLLVEDDGTRAQDSDPDITLLSGRQRWDGLSARVGSELLTVRLQSGVIYTLSVYDYNTHADAGALGYQPTCFDVSLTPL